MAEKILATFNSIVDRPRSAVIRLAIRRFLDFQFYSRSTQGPYIVAGGVDPQILSIL